ncbi:BTBD15 [Mytilus edulis]|uniref:ZBTB44 n=1 Tax=Mytilus edulis TaxID=6550 RepID=A0A8S3QW31_MYTED|nr:BTBD15 [Mytilus edulis]
MATQIFSSIVSTSSTIANYARLGLASQNELPDMLRELLLIKEPPHLLEAHINNNSFLSKNLKAYEWNIIKTVRENSYRDCDVPLMYKIIRNLNIVPNPTQGWDNNTPPSASEITIGDDVERIRRIRNEIVHRGNTNVQDSELANYFSTFKRIANRLESYLSKPEREFVSKIEIAETCCLDKDTEQQYLERLNELAEHEKQLYHERC